MTRSTNEEPWIGVGEPIHYPDDEALPDPEVSDGFHTMSELYAHRTVLFAALCRLRPDLAWRSREHHVGGQPMFPRYFIAGMSLPTGPITYHCEAAFWDEFEGVVTLPNAPLWDGHTSDDVLTRLSAWRRPVEHDSDESSNNKG